MTAPLIFDIVRGAQEDGPGLRTVFFFKGCPLRCRWCHNPESQQPGPEMAYYSERCRRCGQCEQACPNGAIDTRSTQIVRRDLCSACGRCSEACDSLALRVAGRSYSPEQLVDMALRDKVYFDVSGGGVTLSGGEPLLYLEFVEAVVRGLKRHDVHVAVQTCGFFHYATFKTKVLPWIDLIYYDLKLADPGEHEEHTGRKNMLILRNLKRLAAESCIKLVPRIPLVPGYTTNTTNLLRIADLVNELGLGGCALLTYNPSGTGKYVNLGKRVPSGLPQEPLSLTEEAELKRTLDRLPSGNQLDAAQISRGPEKRDDGLRPEDVAFIPAALG